MSTNIESLSYADYDIRTHFRQQLAKWSVKAVCGREYVHVTALRKWMLTISPLGTGARNVDLLLDLCQDKDSAGFAAPATSITDEPRRCLDVFAILLEIERGHLVEKFLKHSIVDSKLPIDLAALENALSQEDLYPEVARDFNRAQWKYRPLDFHLGDSLDEPGNRIIPICEKELIKEGGTAKVYRVLVQEEFVHPNLRHPTSSSFWKDPVYGRCYMMALKTYQTDNKHLFDNEVNAFRGLSGNNGMIKCLLDYSHVELDTYDDGNEEWTQRARGNPTHNIVLVLGKHDLQGFFQSFSPPAMREEILGTWSSVFDLAKAVKQIHHFEAHRSHYTESYYGYHADVKPENILMVGEEFKLADPGFARFQTYGSESTSARMGAIHFWGGTTTFECYLADQRSDQSPSNTSITPAIDIWSLGCVFSVVATWIVLGVQGVEQFTAFRRQAISDARAGTRDMQVGHDTIATGHNDFFHDGRRTLTQIREWHDVLRESIRHCDVVTAAVLDLVEQCMLLDTDHERISAAELEERLDHICGHPEAAEPSTKSQVIRDVIEKQESIYRSDVQRHSEQSHQLKLDISHIEQSLEELDSEPSGTKNQRLGDIIARAREHMRSAKENLTIAPVIETGSSTMSKLQDRRGSSAGYAISKQTIQRSKVSKRIPVSSLNSRSSLSNVTEERTLSHVVGGDPGCISNPQLPTRRSLTSPTPEPRARSRTIDYASSSTTRFARGFNILKSMTKNMIKPRRPDERLQKYFWNRDIAFVVDNGETMLPFWGDAREQLINLVSLAQNVDTDGIDLHFTCNESTFTPTNDISAFRKAMDKQINQPMTDVHTDMSEVIGRILNDYLGRFQQAEKYKVGTNKTKKITIIVLTDGVWRRMNNDLLVDNQIVSFSEQLTKIRGSIEEADRRLSIQFVHFGKDPSATYRLKRLDDKLKFRGVPDIVDTKPAGSDLYKILLGSVDPTIDDEEDQNLHITDDALDGGSFTTSPDDLVASPVTTRDIEAESHESPKYR